MQTRFFVNFLMGMALLVTVAGCQKRVTAQYPTSRSTSSVKILSPSSKGLPPGQAKKIYGHQSAKAFAPGQQKKNGAAVVIVNGKEAENKKKPGKKKK